MSRKEKAMLTRKKIFETSIKLIKEKGYDNVTISEICKESSVAKGTFYVHFDSKEDIVKESYYSDLSEYVLTMYNDYISQEDSNVVSAKNSLSIKEKIIYFIKTEFMFVNHIGFELTCRAYVSNLTECISGKSTHFEKREFGTVLKDLIIAGTSNNSFNSTKTSDELFLYIESFSRGITASWCFSNASFDIVLIGENFIRDMVGNL